MKPRFRLRSSLGVLVFLLIVNTTQSLPRLGRRNAAVVILPSDIKKQSAIAPNVMENCIEPDGGCGKGQWNEDVCECVMPKVTLATISSSQKDPVRTASDVVAQERPISPDISKTDLNTNNKVEDAVAPASPEPIQESPERLSPGSQTEEQQQPASPSGQDERKEEETTRVTAASMPAGNQDQGNTAGTTGATPDNAVTQGTSVQKKPVPNATVLQFKPITKNPPTSSSGSNDVGVPTDTTGISTSLVTSNGGVAKEDTISPNQDTISPSPAPNTQVDSNTEKPSTKTSTEKPSQSATTNAQKPSSTKKSTTTPSKQRPKAKTSPTGSNGVAAQKQSSSSKSSSSRTVYLVIGVVAGCAILVALIAFNGHIRRWKTRRSPPNTRQPQVLPIQTRNIGHYRFSNADNDAPPDFKVEDDVYQGFQMDDRIEVSNASMYSEFNGHMMEAPIPSPSLPPTPESPVRRSRTEISSTYNPSKEGRGTMYSDVGSEVMEDHVDMNHLSRISGFTHV